MIYDLRFTICSSRREEALIGCGLRITDCGTEGVECVNVTPDYAKRLECVVFSDALHTTGCVMTVGALPGAVLKPTQSRRFATSEALLSLAPGLRPLTE